MLFCPRVWPLNFMAAYFSASHSSECVGVETTPDGQQILCTCGDSAVELLNLATQQHLQVSRAHPARVLHASTSGMLFFRPQHRAMHRLPVATTFRAYLSWPHFFLFYFDTFLSIVPPLRAAYLSLSALMCHISSGFERAIYSV